MPAFVEPSWVRSAKQTIGTDVEAVYPMKTVHGGNQVPDTEANPIGYRYDNGKSQYQYLDLAGAPTNLVNRGNLGEAIKTLAPIGLSMIGANFLGPALNDLFGPAASDLFGGGGSEFGAGAGDFLSGAPQLTPAAIEAGLGTAGYGANASAAASGLFDVAKIGAGAAGTVADLLSGTSGAGTTPLSNIAATGAKTALTPAAIESLSGTAGYGTNASAIQAAIDAGINPSVVGSGANLTIDNLVNGVTGINASAKTLADAKAAADAAAAAGTADAAAKAKVAADAKAAADAAAAAGGGSSLLKSLTDATGLSGTQLAALFSGLTGAGNAANLTSAINTGLDATTAANTASQGVLKDIYNQQLGFQKPYQLTGTTALTELGKLGSGTYQIYDPVTGLPTTTGTGSGYLQHQFDASDLAKGLAPNYDFMLQQGQMANQRAANVGGGALSGNTLQGLNKYTQDYAGNAYQNAFKNYQDQRNSIYTNLAGMAGIGQTANTGAQAAGTSYGKGTTDLNTALANAQAAASIGKAQALAGGTSGLANSTFLASLLAPPK